MARAPGLVRFLLTAAGLALAALRDGRLPLSPRRWLIDLRHLRGRMRAGSAAAGVSLPAASETRATLRKRRLRELDAFLTSGGTLVFAPAAAPVTSVIIVLFNRAELTLACLSALASEQADPFEVVVVDNASTDRTPELLRHVEGIEVIRQPENIGFLRACNEAARRARGQFLLFLNNDADVLPGALAHAVDAVRRSADVGAVGGRLILPDGRLQEAGSIIWNDGSCEGYRRGRDPADGECLFERDVDYSSGALLLTPRQTFLDLGGFDDRFAPAYYEDADYCLRLWQSGRRVVYRPDVAALHHEFGSSLSTDDAIGMQEERRARFVAKHSAWLSSQHYPRSVGTLVARARGARRGRVLIVDDRPPDRSAGFGFPRAAELVQALDDLGHFVTVYCTGFVPGSGDDARRDVNRTVEVVSRPGSPGLSAFLHERRGYYGRIIVSRAHNMELLRARFGAPSAWSPGARILYDAEAVTALREAGRRRIAGESVDEATVALMVRQEAKLATDVDAVLAVSADERRALIAGGCRNVHVVSHAVEIAPTGRAFEDRQGLLFVGAFHESSPNTDAILWFVRHVLPRVRNVLGHAVELTIAGQNPPAEVRALAGSAVRVPGGVGDLGPLYDAARVFVAPTRFAAGIPLKVIHAAAAGLPVVASGLLCRQLAWAEGRDLLMADSADDFAAACVILFTDRERWNAVRAAALERVRTDFSRSRFRQQVAAALS
ncbi:MAG TPA: glycosyltransferase [Vicinamibacterales bacterium]|nr:glycosyltransferase [Vicinamibacterales bacterium]